MKILALDTTAKAASVALTEDEKLLVNFHIEKGLTHSETVEPMLELALKLNNLEIDDIDIFCATDGPGSFTGVRIAISMIKGLSFGKNKPCVGVSTLEVIATGLKDISKNAIICPVMDARRSQLYNAIFKIEDGKMSRLIEDRLISLDDLKKELDSYSLPIYACGDGYSILKNGYDNLEETPVLLRTQTAYNVALVALKTYLNSEDKESFSDLLMNPKYLRASQAERELNEKGETL